jgi:peptide deformylase
MSILKIVTVGNPVLVRAAEPIIDLDREILDLARDMVLTMHAAPGIGLAAPQVNVGKRLIAVDLSIGEQPEDLIILVNPELVEAEGEEISEEGCLSVPGIQEKVRRPARVRVRGINLQGREKDIEARGLLARVFCHEIDHINGKLFFENLSPLKRALIKNKLKRNRESGSAG